MQKNLLLKILVILIGLVFLRSLFIEKPSPPPPPQKQVEQVEQVEKEDAPTPTPPPSEKLDATPPAAPAGDPQVVALQAIRATRTPCIDVMRARRKDDGTILAQCEMGDHGFEMYQISTEKRYSETYVRVMTCKRAALQGLPCYTRSSGG